MTASDPPRATEPRRRLGDHPAVAALIRAAPWLVPTLLMVLAAVLLLNRLHLPPRIIFDETYYVNDARSFLLLGGVEDSFAVHPPVGKWMIAFSIQLVGDTALGWRLLGALSGLLMVHLTYLTGLRLFRSRALAFLAGLFLATDGLFLAQARTSMLDIYLALFIVLGAWLLVRDLQSLDHHSRTAGGLARRGLGSRWLAGASFGLAVATKWSGLLALATTLVLVVGFEVIAHRRTGAKGIGAARLAWVTVGPLLLLPATVYVATYVPWLTSYEHTTEGKEDCPGAAEGEVECEATAGDRLHGLWREHFDMWHFHENLESTHSYRAEPWTWPVLGRPVAYFYETCKPDRPADADPCEVPLGMAAEVLAVGNPIFWWTFAGVLPLLGASVGRRNPTSWVIGGFYGGLFLPWMLVARPAFLFYMVPAVPFMALGLAHAIGLVRARPRDPLPWLAGLGAGGTAAASAAVAGASRPGIGIAFGIGWMFAPMVVAPIWERIAARRVLEEAASGEVELGEDQTAGSVEETSDVPGEATRALPPEPSFAPWWPSRPVWPSHGGRAATVFGGIVVVLVLAALVYFLPIWTGVPMEPDALRTRWIFPSWI